MRRALAILAVTLCACSSAPATALAPGTYGGSTKNDVAVELAVGGNVVTVNDKRTKLLTVDDNTGFQVNRRPEQAASFVDDSVWHCAPAARGRELSCRVSWADHSAERIELMKE